MPYVGLSVQTRPEADCQKSYNFVKTYQLPFGIQNGWTQPYAKTYVSKLIQETSGAAKQPGALAVVTGVTIGGAGYHMALELALQAEMHVVLLGRSASKLDAAKAAMEKEAKARKLATPTLYTTSYDLDSLASAQTSADFVTKLAKETYDGKLHVLLNNAGAVSAKPVLTQDGVEANVGRNYVTVHRLTELLLPLLKAAATKEYKPRIVDVASISHIFGGDVEPQRLVEFPQFGGAPEGRVVDSEDENGKGIAFPVDPMMEGAIYMYGRAKLAVVLATKHLQTLHPELNFCCLHPGSIASNFGGDMGVVSKIYYWGFYFFQYTPSQGAVASLRACLDPDFDTEPDLQGAYLHCDGNPWTTGEDLKAINPATNKVYTFEECAKATVETTDQLIAKLLTK